MTDQNTIYDAAVIGAGPAGMMAAIRAGHSGKKVVLLERNDAPGKKLLLTGNGRCNLTNAASLDEFIDKFKPNGEFLRTAFFKFSNQDLMDFFQSNGLEVKVEKQGKVYPVTDKAASVVAVLEKSLKDNGVETIYGRRVEKITARNACFEVAVSGQIFKAKKVVLAAGGASYPATGSTGDGFALVSVFGHTIAPVLPGLVPLTVKEAWVKDLQGLSFADVRLIFYRDNKKISSDIGEMLFTHYGISGPLVLDISSEVAAAVEARGATRLCIDFLPGSTRQDLESGLFKDFNFKSGGKIANILQAVFPKRMVGVFLGLLSIPSSSLAGQINKKDRLAIVEMLKAFPLTVTGSLSFDEAMVTCGGVSRKEINPRTMESRIVPGLYFCGEVIEGAASSGGYNLQQAFSTGYLAGESLCER